MKLTFGTATDSDVSELAALHRAAAQQLTQEFGAGVWSSAQTENGVRRDLSRPKFSRILIARTSDHCLVATLRLATKKPWAIDTTYFTAAQRPLYLTSMAVHPRAQRKGVGRRLLQEANAAIARAWPADAIRLDAFDAAAGAAPFYAKCGLREIAHVGYKNNPLVYFELPLLPFEAQPCPPKGRSPLLPRKSNSAKS